MIWGGSEDTALDPCGSRRAVDLENAVEATEVEGDRAAVARLGGRLDAADHAILFRPPDSLVIERPELPVPQKHDELLAKIKDLAA